MKIKSLTLRISIVVTIMTLFVLLATLLTIYYASIERHRMEAKQETLYKLDLASERLSKVQLSVEQTASYATPALEAAMDDTLAVVTILNNIVESNLYVNCAALAYAPNRLPHQPYCMPIAINYGIASHYFSDKDLNGEYIYDDWYIAPALEGKPFWTAPSFNLFDVPVVNYAIPVKDKNGKFEGVLTLAVELTGLNKLLSTGVFDKKDSTMQDRSVITVEDRNTNFITTQNKEYIMNETLFTLAESKNDTLYSYIGKEILAGRDGEAVGTIDGEKSVITWRVLPLLDWTTMVITPYSEVYAAVYSLTTITFIVALLAALAAIAILFFAVRRALRPFDRLKAATRLMGEGNYDVQLPEQLTKRHDEVGELGREFMRMEEAVKKNIEDLEEEHKKVKRSYDMLSTLMHNVVGHLRLPLNNLLTYNDALATMANNTEEAQIVKSESKEAGISILQQFNQLNELSNLISSEDKSDDTMIVVPSDEFVDGFMKGVHQLEQRYFLTINEEFKDKRVINIRSNTHVLESLLFELIIEAAKVSKTQVVGLYFMFNQKATAMRIFIEAKTDQPIPEADKENFFVRFAEEKVNAYATSTLLPLYICYRTAHQLGLRLYVEPGQTKDTPSNIFVLEIPKAG